MMVWTLPVLMVSWTSGAQHLPNTGSQSHRDTLYPNTTYPSAQLLLSLPKVPHFESTVPNTS